MLLRWKKFLTFTQKPETGSVNIFNHQTVLMRKLYAFLLTAFSLFVTSDIFAQPCSENFDGVTVPALPASWIVTTATTCTGSLPWATVNTTSDSPPNSVFTNNATCVSDEWLDTRQIPIVSPAAQITFRRSNDLEAGFDGLVLEISIGGGPFQDIITAGGSFVAGAYTHTISTAWGSPIAGPQAWSGNSGGFVTTTINLPASANGQIVIFRFRRATDSSFGDTGAFIDEISVAGSDCNLPCTSPSFTMQPLSTSVCSGSNTSFTVATTGIPTPTYQWQVNNGSGFVNLTNTAPYSGVTTATLTLTTPGLALSGNSYRCVATNFCAAVNSNAVTLTVSPLPTISVAPNGLCAPVVLTAGGSSNTYSWSPATALSATTGATVTASPNATTTYTVTGTITVTGCQNSATVTVLGTPAPPVITPATSTICAGAYQPLTVAPVLATYSSTGSISVPFGAPGTTSGAANPYPSSITVSGLPATGVKVKSVTINGVVHTFPDDMDILLQSPTGTNVILMSDVGGGTDLTGQNYTFDDAAAALMADGALNATGTYRPTNFGTPDTWAAPGPGSVDQATPTLASFSGNPNGNWGLFVVDDAGGDVGSIASWSITFEVSTARWTPVTGLFLDPNGATAYTAGTFASTVYASPAATTTYTATAALGSCAAPGSATATVTVNPRPVVTVSPNNQCSPVTLTAAGTSNTYSWSPAAGLSATTGATVTATPIVNTTYTVTGTITATGCTNTATATVNATPAAPVVTPSAITLCPGGVATLTAAPSTRTVTSTGMITIPTTLGNATPYPAAITVSGLPTSGVTIKSVTLNGVSHTFPVDLDILLQSPTNTNVVIMSDVGGTSAITNRDYVFDDAAAAAMTTGTAASGTYKPSNSGATDNWPAPGPGSITQGTPLLSSFTGNPNGVWNLFVTDDASLDGGSITSWSITFNIAGAQWSPAAGLFTNVTATTPYVAGTLASIVYASPTATTTYSATVASPTCTSPAGTAVVTVLQPLTVTTQPASQTVCQGANATFTAVVGGVSPSYQWQVSTDGGTTWTNIAGANNASLLVPAVTTASNGFRYRVIANNSCSSITSSGAATLTVSTPSAITITPLPARICLSDTLVALSASPVGGSWSGIGISGNNFVPPATAVGTYTLTYSYNNTAGCASSGTVVARVQDCPERIVRLADNAVILFPNPNDGRFNIRINSTLYNYLGMRVYTASGQLVRIQNFSGLVFGRVIPVDLTNLPGGTYMVKFYYDDGVRTSEKTFPVIVGK